MCLLKALRLGRVGRIAIIRLTYCSIKGERKVVPRAGFESAIWPTLYVA
jgi:hypothetical protein